MTEYVANFQLNNNPIELNSALNSQPLQANLILQNIPTRTKWGNITGDLSSQTDLQTALNGKQPTISDLDTIRSGASKGATALQPNDDITQLNNNVGYITSSALNGYATENFVTSQGYITQAVDDNSTTSTTLGWSANKLNGIIGDIETLLNNINSGD